MSGLSDSMVLTFSCPKCGKQIKETLGRLQGKNKLVCQACGPMALNGEALKTARRSLQEFERATAKLSTKITFKL